MSGQAAIADLRIDDTRLLRLHRKGWVPALIAAVMDIPPGAALTRLKKLGHKPHGGVWSETKSGIALRNRDRFAQGLRPIVQERVGA